LFRESPFSEPLLGELPFRELLFSKLLSSKLLFRELLFVESFSSPVCPAASAGAAGWAVEAGSAGSADGEGCCTSTFGGRRFGETLDAAPVAGVARVLVGDGGRTLRSPKLEIPLSTSRVTRGTPPGCDCGAITAGSGFDGDAANGA
jgi:hypothetical protein